MWDNSWTGVRSPSAPLTKVSVNRSMLFFYIQCDTVMHIYRMRTRYEDDHLDASQIIEDLHERNVGDAGHDFWQQQYEDHDYKNPNGESLNEVKKHMNQAVHSILGQMKDGETVLSVSHATAICAYLLNFCEIQGNDPKQKIRKILFHDEIIMNGKIDPMNFFVLHFDHGTMTGISFHH